MSKNFINELSSRSAFKVGLLSGLAVTFVVGFFILLGLVVNKDDNGDDSNGLSAANPLVAIAKELGVNSKKLNKCIEADKFADKIASDSRSGQDAGARGTPYNVILSGDLKVVIPGALPYSQVQEMLATIMAGGTPENNDPNLNIEGIRDGDRVLGDKGAPITIVEYSDLDCPYCKRFHGTMHQVIDNYDNVNWVFRHFPLPQLHPDATNKAKTAECVGDVAGEDKFWEFIDVLSKE